MKKRIENDEINLLEASIFIWNNKFKIAAITIIFMFFTGILYTAIFKQITINAKTEILPISIFENDNYSSYNLLIKDLLIKMKMELYI